MAVYRNILLADNPVLYYRLGEHYNGTVARDESSGWYDGTYTGGYTQNETGLVFNDPGLSVLFNGSSGYVAVPAGFSAAGFTSLSIEGVFKPTTAVQASSPALIANDTPSTTNKGFAVYLNSTGTALVFRLGNGSTFATCTCTYTLTDGVPYHFAAVYNGTTMTLYIKNLSTGATATGTQSLSGTIGTSTHPVNLAHNPAGTDYFNGYLQDFAIYRNTALSSTKVATRQAAAYNGSGVGPYSVTIGRGIPVTNVAGTLSADNMIGQRGQASLTVKIDGTSTYYQQYQPVDFYDGSGVRYFQGFIAAPVETKPGYQSSLINTMTITDNHFLADKRVVFDSGTTLAKVYTGKGFDYILQDLYNNILSAEGVTIGSFGNGLSPSTTLSPSTSLAPAGPYSVIPLASFNYATMAQVCDALVKAASASGVQFYWFIDQNKQFWFQPYNTTIGPTVDGTKIDRVRKPPRVTRAQPLYRNTQYVAGGTSPVGPYFLYFSGGANNWICNWPLAQAPQIWLNGNVASVGILGASSGKQFYYSVGSPTITPDPTNNTVSTDTIEVEYYGQFPNTFSQTNSTEVTNQRAIDGTSGIIESVLKDTQITSSVNGFSEASQLLTEYCLRGKKFEFTTQESDFAIGQLITVNYSPLGFSGTTMLVAGVHVDDSDGLNIWFTITAVVGPYDTTWAQFFGKVLQQTEQSSSINVGV